MLLSKMKNTTYSFYHKTRLFSSAFVILYIKKAVYNHGFFGNFYTFPRTNSNPSKIARKTKLYTVKTAKYFPFRAFSERE